VETKDETRFACSRRGEHNSFFFGEELFEGNLDMARQRAVADDSVSRDLLAASRTIRPMHRDQDAALFEIRHIADQINTRTLPVSKLARSLRIGTPRLYQWFAVVGGPLIARIGRFPLPDRHLIEERVRQFQEVWGIHCGYRHTAQSLALPGQPPPYHTVYQILHSLPRPVD
jgi:hypothetical protein